MGDNARGGSTQHAQPHTQRQPEQGVLVDAGSERVPGKHRRHGLAPQQHHPQQQAPQQQQQPPPQQAPQQQQPSRRQRLLHGHGVAQNQEEGRGGSAHPEEPRVDDDGDGGAGTVGSTVGEGKQDEAQPAMAQMLVDGGLFLQRGRSDPQLLLLVARALSRRYGIPVKEIHFFDATIEKRYHDFPGMQRINDERCKFHENLRRLSGDPEKGGVFVELHLRHLKPIAVPCPNTRCPKHHPRNLNIRAIQAGVDVDIASFALKPPPGKPKNVTHLYCWLGDGDLAPTLEALRGPLFNKQIRILNTDPAVLSIGLRAVTSKREIIDVFELLKADSA